MLVPYTYASIGYIYCIFLSSLALNAIFLTSSKDTLCFLLLNLCCDFNISLLFFINYLWFSWILFTSNLFFLIDLFYFQVELLLNKIGVKFSFYDTLLTRFLLFRFHGCHLLNNYNFLVSMQQTLPLFSHVIHISLIKLLFHFPF